MGYGISLKKNDDLMVFQILCNRIITQYGRKGRRRSVAVCQRVNGYIERRRENMEFRGGQLAAIQEEAGK